MTDFEFDLGDLGEETEEPTDADNDIEPLKEWADEQLADKSGGSGGAVCFDIETVPAPEGELKDAYHEKTLEEFSQSCDKRWKPDTVAAKFQDYRATAWDEFVGKAALSPVTGRVAMIGMVQYGCFVGLVDGSETANLEAFWERVEFWLANKSPIIGHNSNSFDLPFLVRRSWMLGVPVPREVRQGRYWHPLFRDTMEVWAFGAREYTSLNDIAATFRVGQKTEGVHGRDFHRLWFGTMPAEEWGIPAEQRAKAIEYCEQDVRLTAAIAEKMGLV